MAKNHILIVDDDLMLLSSLKRMLEDVYDVTLASGGQKAIDFINIQDAQFDLILSDVNMPDINGVNLFLYIAQDHPKLKNRIIFMTGAPVSAYLDDFLASNNAICLAKPFAADELHQIIKKLLEQS